MIIGGILAALAGVGVLLAMTPLFVIALGVIGVGVLGGGAFLLAFML